MKMKPYLLSYHNDYYHPHHQGYHVSVRSRERGRELAIVTVTGPEHQHPGYEENISIHRTCVHNTQQYKN